MMLVISGTVALSSSELTLSDLGVWVGSFGTVLTLIFLTYQQVKTSERQQILDSKEQYKEQKLDFYEALDSIESNGYVEVKERFHLYHKLYNHGKGNQYIGHLSIIKEHINRLFLSIEQLQLVETEDKSIEVIYSLSKIGEFLNLELTNSSMMRKNGDVFMGKKYLTNIFDFNYKLTILLECYNKILWVVDREHKDIETKKPLNSEGKTRILLSSQIINDIDVKLEPRILLLAHIYMLLVDEQIGLILESEVYDFRKQLSYLFAQGPDFFSVFDEDTYYQEQVSSCLSYLKLNETHIIEKSRLKYIYFLSNQFLESGLQHKK